MAAEPESYYKVIDGIKYDRKLLALAEDFAKDGQISFAEAKMLFQDAQDGQGVTDTERKTLEYTMENFKCTDKAKEYLKAVLADGKVANVTVVLDGVKFDRELLEKAVKFLETGGVVSYAEAKELWDDAQDGPGVTACEMRTLAYTLQTLKYTAKAAAFLKPLCEAGKSESSYKEETGEPDAKRARPTSPPPTSSQTTAPPPLSSTGASGVLGTFSFDEQYMKEIAYEKIFKKMDKDGSGAIDFEEFGSACSKRDVQITMPKWKTMSNDEKPISMEHFKHSMLLVDAPEGGEEAWKELHSKCRPEIHETLQEIKAKVATVQKQTADAKFEECNKGNSDPDLSIMQFMKAMAGLNWDLTFEEAQELFRIAAGERVNKITKDQWFKMLTDPEARKKLLDHDSIMELIKDAHRVIKATVKLAM